MIKRLLLICVLISNISCARRLAMSPPAIYSQEWKDKDVIVLKSEMADFIHEKYLYKIRWLGLTVAEAEFENLGLEEYDGIECYHVAVRVRTHKVLNYIFKVKDEFHSYINSENFKPLAYIVRRREGGYRSESKTIFDYENNKLIYHSILDDSKKEMELKPDYYDFFSCFYKLRASDLNEDLYSFKTVQRAKVWQVDIGVIKKGVLELRGHGTPDVVLVNIKAVCGEERARGEAWIWFSANKGKVPLLGQFNVDIPVVGTIRMALES